MKPSLPLDPRVCAVVVTYNPHPTFTGNIEALGAQVHHIVVVDNGSSGGPEQLLQTLETRQDCTLIRNHQNLGIAAALNLGVKYAIDAGFNWVATFDQDSRVSDGFISQMLQTYRQASHPGRIALIAPTYVDQ
jgi:rhamnosyltransferase